MTTEQKIAALQNVKNTGNLEPADLLPDEQNPKYLFNLTSNNLLSKIVSGEIDARELAWQQLRNRGRNAEGIWCGFPKQGKAEPEKPFGKMFF